ncbi:MAG: homoserine O-succinyltransferase MetX [Arenicella sp.]
MNAEALKTDLPANSIGIVTPKTMVINSPLELECGETLTSHSLVYETYGELNTEKSNAILICHALSGNHHAAGFHENSRKSEGWWNELIGPGKTIDTNRFFVVCSNNIGGCHGSTGPTSINPKTNEQYGPDFPIVTVADWVNSQALFSDQLGIDVWAAIIGGSLGGMQALEWSTRFPDRLQHAILAASSSKLTAQNIAFNEVARQAIRRDPEFYAGRYFDHNAKPVNGLRVARMLGHITYLSDDMMAEKFGRALQDKQLIDFSYDAEFAVESYLRYQGDRFADQFDANTYLLMTKALDYFDPAKSHDDNLSDALKTAKANFLVMSFTSDWRFSPERSREIVKALQDNRLNVSYAEINAPQGHDAFLMQIEDYIDVFQSYMNKIKV